MVPVARAASWAAASMPRASPEAMTNPAAPRAAARSAAMRQPAAAVEQAEVADGAQHGRCIGNGGQRRRVGGIAEDDESTAQAGQRLFLSGDGFVGGRREGGARLLRRAEMLQGLVESHGADAGAARQSKSGAALLGIEFGLRWVSDHGPRIGGHA